MLLQYRSHATLGLLYYISTLLSSYASNSCNFDEEYPESKKRAISVEGVILVKPISRIAQSGLSGLIRLAEQGGMRDEGCWEDIAARFLERSRDGVKLCCVGYLHLPVSRILHMKDGKPRSRWLLVVPIALEKMIVASCNVKLTSTVQLVGMIGPVRERRDGSRVQSDIVCLVIHTLIAFFPSRRMALVEFCDAVCLDLYLPHLPFVESFQ